MSPAYLEASCHFGDGAFAGERGDQRHAPVRIVFVVDHRLVVDDAFHRAQKIAERVIGHFLECFGEGRLGFVGLLILPKQERLFAPGFGIVGVLGDNFVHNAECGVVLPDLILLKGLGDFLMDRLAAPLELLAAATGT